MLIVGMDLWKEKIINKNADKERLCQHSVVSTLLITFLNHPTRNIMSHQESLCSEHMVLNIELL